MCGSLSGYRSWKEIHRLYRLTVTEQLKEVDPQPSGIVRPTDQQPFIRQVQGTNILDVGVWGFPSRKEKGKPILNARCETMEILPTFREAVVQRRCVVPATGYYEWKKEADGHKTPWRFSLDTGGDQAPVFVMAGLFMVDRKTRQRRFVIVTTEPNDLAAEVHDRMPVILTESMMKTWLSPKTPPLDLRQLCKPYEEGNLVAEAMPRSSHQRPKPVDENQFTLGL